MTDLEPYRSGDIERRPPRRPMASTPATGIGIIATGGLLGVGIAGLLIVPSLAVAILAALIIPAIIVAAAIAMAVLADRGFTFERSTQTRLRVPPKDHR